MNGSHQGTERWTLMEGSHQGTERYTQVKHSNQGTERHREVHAGERSKMPRGVEMLPGASAAGSSSSGSSWVAPTSIGTLIIEGSRFIISVIHTMSSSNKGVHFIFTTCVRCPPHPHCKRASSNTCVQAATQACKQQQACIAPQACAAPFILTALVLALTQPALLVLHSQGNQQACA